MNLKRITIALLAIGALFTACRQEEELGVPKLTVNPAEISLEKGEASQDVEILATRDWYISSSPEWAAVSVVEGKASSKPQSVTVSVNANAGYDRTGEIKFSIGLAKASLLINQKGDKGKLSLGSGTKEDPYTVAGVIAYTQSLGKDVESPASVFFKGIVTTVSTTFEGSGTYGNATFYIQDPDGGEQFYCFQTYYLGNRKWKKGDTEIKADDEVIMCGKVVNYRGNTPETVGKGGSFIYSLNGKTEGGEPVDPGEGKGSGTLDDPFNVAAAVNAVQGLTWTSNDVYDKVGPYYVKGVISVVDEAYSAQFGNGTFHIKDADGSAEFYVFRALYLNNKKWTSKDTQIKVGDEVIIYSELMNYRGNTPETVQNSGYLYSLNGNTGGGEGQQQTEITACTIADFIAKADGSTYYRLTGTVSDFSKGTTSAGKNWMQFNLKDDTGSILVYGFKDGQYDQWVSKIKNGGTAVVTGTYEFYSQKSQHEVMNATIESFTEGPGQTQSEPSGNGTLESPYNAAAAYQLASTLDAESKTDNVYIAGKISSIKYTFTSQHGTATFNFSDDGTSSVTEFTCYSVYYLENTSWQEGQTQIKVGDSVVIYGKLCNYQGNTPETASKEAYLYSLNGNTKAEEVDPGTNPGTGGDSDFASNVSWTASKDDVSYTQDAKVNGVAIQILKLGTGSAAGHSTISSSTAFSKVTFYAISWKDKPSELVFKVGGSEVAKISPAANAGLAGNPTYTITVTDSDKYTVDLGSSVTEFTVETSGSNTRAALFAIKAE